MRYFINGKEITPEQAEKQDQKNNDIMKIENPAEWLEAMKDARFIFTMKNKEEWR